jgi:beta-glucosidase
MKRLLRIVGLILLVLLLGILITGFVTYKKKVNRIDARYATLGEEAGKLELDGQVFRDLNKNGKLDIYEDHRAKVEERVNDLVAQMTLEEKAGAMYITMNGFQEDGTPIDKPFLSTNPLDIMAMSLLPTTSKMIVDKKMNSFNIIASSSAEAMASYNNNMQKLAERTRLGIPVTIATDPRHGAQNNPGAALYTPAFSQWPSSLGLAATRDTVLVREFADIARQEYLSVGIRLALHPMADLATEPRWGRSNGTFGEDAELSAQMTKAYVLGFQGDSLGSHSVACMTKHFSGGGPQEDGEDAHFEYGKNQVYPGDNFDYHLIPFEKGAFPAKTSQIMPYYGIPIDQTEENVAFAFNKTIITKMLREKYGFDGVICTDWNIISGSKMGDARAWGVENLSPLARTKKVLDAGCDQFGGEYSPELIIELVESGQIEEDRIDASVSRIMRDKFILGLFDDPYVEKDKAAGIAGIDKHREMGKAAQAKGTVLLKNEGLLPLKKGSKMYLEGVNDEASFSLLGEVVYSPDEADVIIKRINTPFEERDQYFLEQFFHQGRLYYTEEELGEVLELTRQKPTIVVANLERPAILTQIDESCASMMVEFGLEDEVLAKMVFGEVAPEGKLPFELPSSWEAVLEQKEDLPYDSKDPLYEFGHGLSYPQAAISMN